MAKLSDVNSTVYELSKALPNKLLNADGSITDFQGNLISPANEANVEVYNKAKATVNKFVTESGENKTYAEISFDLFVIVDSLPEEGDKNKIYLVPSDNGMFDEYFWNPNNKWDKIGEVKIDLSNYPTKSEVTKQITDATTANKSYTDEQIKTNITNVLGGEY